MELASCEEVVLCCMYVYARDSQCQCQFECGLWLFDECLCFFWLSVRGKTRIYILAVCKQANDQAALVSPISLGSERKNEPGLEALRTSYFALFPMFQTEKAHVFV